MSDSNPESITRQRAKPAVRGQRARGRATIREQLEQAAVSTVLDGLNAAGVDTSGLSGTTNASDVADVDNDERLIVLGSIGMGLTSYQYATSDKLADTDLRQWVNDTATSATNSVIVKHLREPDKFEHWPLIDASGQIVPVVDRHIEPDLYVDGVLPVVYGTTIIIGVGNVGKSPFAEYIHTKALEKGPSVLIEHGEAFAGYTRSPTQLVEKLFRASLIAGSTIVVDSMKTEISRLGGNAMASGVAREVFNAVSQWGSFFAERKQRLVVIMNLSLNEAKTMAEFLPSFTSNPTSVVVLTRDGGFEWTARTAPRKKRDEGQGVIVYGDNSIVSLRRASNAAGVALQELMLGDSQRKLGDQHGAAEVGGNHVLTFATVTPRANARSTEQVGVPSASTQSALQLFLQGR